MSTATEIVGTLAPLAGQVAYADSLRRMRETIGDVDILATAAEEKTAAEIMNAFKSIPERGGGAGGRPGGSAEVIVSDPTKTSIRTAAGL